VSGIEDILRQVMAGHDQDAPAAPDLLRALQATPGAPGRRRQWSGLLVPLAAAAAVTAVVAASLAIGAALQGRPAGPGPAAQSHRSPAPLRPAALRPAALRQVPRYFTALTGPVQAQAAVVRSTLTGHVLATVIPPRPYQIFTWVSAAADDRTFVLAAQQYWPIASGQAGLPAEHRDNTTPTAFFRMTFDPATHTAKLARLAAAPETIQSAQLAGMTVSPDGTRLALDLRQSIQVVTLATGAIRSWAWHGDGWIGNFKPFGQVFSWTADGTTLAFQQWGPGHPRPIYIRLLDTIAPGTTLASSKIALTFPDASALGTNTLLTPDGTRIVTATPQGITEFSVRTGQPLLSQDQFHLGLYGWQDVLWAGPGGHALVVSDPRGKHTRYGPGHILGVLTANTFTPIPHAADQGAQIAW